MLRLLIIPAVLVALLVGAVVWSREAGGDRADFAFVNRGDVKSLDLNTMSYEQDIRLAYALWEGLYTTDPVSLRPIPGAADRIDLSPDGRTYTFHLRPDGKWSNGDPVTADDFAFEWRRMLESPGEYSGLHDYIEGAGAYAAGYAAYVKAKGEGKPADKPDFATVGERVLDPLTFRVTLVRPVAYFPACCAFPPFYPLNRRVMADFAQTDPATGAVTYKPEYVRPPNLVTNGPYRLDSWAFKQRLRMVANDHYWNRAAVAGGPRTIDQVYCEDPLAALRLYQAGAVDWLCEADGETAAAMLKQGGHPDLHLFPGFGTYFYELNCGPTLPDGKPNPLRDVRVRQALSMAIDKAPIVSQVGRMNQPIATTYIPVGVFPGYASPPGLPYDVARARQLLADAGYPNGTGLPRLPVRFNTEGGAHGDIAVIVAGQWKRNLGIDVELQGTELKQFGEDLHSHHFTISRASWSGDYDDPSTFTDKYLSSSQNNDADWHDPTYDDACAAAAKERDPAERFALLSRAEDRLLDQAPIIPLYSYVSTYLFHDNVHGMSLSPRKVQMFQAIRVDPRK